MEYVAVPAMPESNLIYVECEHAGMLVEEMGLLGVLCFPLSSTVVRLVTHLEIGKEDLVVICEVVRRSSEVVHGRLLSKKVGEGGVEGGEGGKEEYGSWNTN